MWKEINYLVTAKNALVGKTTPDKGTTHLDLVTFLELQFPDAVDVDGVILCVATTAHSWVVISVRWRHSHGGLRAAQDATTCGEPLGQVKTSVGDGVIRSEKNGCLG